MSRIVLRRRIFFLLTLFAPFILAACATPEAAGVRGPWMPVNRFAETPQAIPLRQAYIFQASPVDGTLKAMLTRWAKDAGLSLSYLHPNDYTLHAPIAQIRTSSLEDAAVMLSSAYSAQGISITVERPRIVVSQVLASDGATAAVEQSD